MYELKIDTSKFENKKRKSWEMQLHNDLCIRLNGLNWTYKTKSGLKDRLDALQGKGNAINIHSESNHITLRDESYGSQRVRIGLPGICTGYVSWDRVESQLDKQGYVRIPFTSFYDARAINKSLGLDKCYIEIRKIS